MTKQAFTYGKDCKFSPEEATYNGVKGAIWTRRDLSTTGWLHMGKQFVKASATRADVVNAFDLVVKPELINAK